MGLRPACSTRRYDGPANTRQAHRKMSKAFVRGVPGGKCHTFQTGILKGDYGLKLTLVATDWMQLRHNQLESARVTINQYLVKGFGPEGFYMKFYAYPHHIVRENALATGAGADRFQSGMSKAFGKPAGTAARVKPGTKLFAAWVPAGNEKIVKLAFRKASNKLSTHTKTVVEQLKTATTK